MRLLVYSHDAFGLASIRRILTTSQQLRNCVPNLSMLILSGSHMLQQLRLPPGLDYIKLPCVYECDEETFDSRLLRTLPEDAIALRSRLIRTAILSFQPDVFLVDQTPAGLEEELLPTLNDLNLSHSCCQLVLLLENDLDEPDGKCPAFTQEKFNSVIARHYNEVWVIGLCDIRDVLEKYPFSPTVAGKVRLFNDISHKSSVFAACDAVVDRRAAIKPVESIDVSETRSPLPLWPYSSLREMGQCCLAQVF